MSADEIVRALRSYASDCSDDDACCQCTFAWMCNKLDGCAPKIIADTLERLNDFEHSQCAVLLARIAELEAQLAESQRQLRAAVEDAEQGSVCRTCHYLNNGCDPLNLDAGCHKWQWRGPGAGEGAAK